MLPRSDHRPGPRWWPALALLLLLGLRLVWIWGFAEQTHRQGLVESTVIASGLVFLLLLVWWSLFSRVRWAVRGTLLGVLVGVGALAVATLRFTGVSGDLVPQLEWRWSSIAQSASGAGERVTGEPRPTADYPQFLGPTRDGSVTGIRLARDWEAEPPRVLWRKPIGAGWSGFAVVGNSAVTQDQVDNVERIICHDLVTGEVRWTHSDPVRFEEPISGAGPRATPTIDGNRVFTMGATGVLNSLDLQTGSLIWSRDVTRDQDAGIPEYGFSGSPLVTGGRVIVIAGGADGHSLAAYDADNGEPVWSAGSERAAYSSPGLHQLGGRDQIVFLGDSHLVGHDAIDGAPLWAASWPEQTMKVSQPLVLSGDRVFASSGYGIGGKLFRVSQGPDGSWTPEELWASRGLKAKFTNVVQRNGYLYGLDDGILVCIDLEDGSRRWKAGRYGHGQLMLVDDLLLIQTEGGDIAMVAAEPEGHRELGRLSVLEGKSWNHPALAGRFLLVRNDREAVCLELPLRPE